MKIKNNLLFLLLFLALLLPLFDLLHPGLPITHDGKDHVARIANFYRNLSEGNIIPRWAPDLNWGYGHPILMFLYPLPSYTASLFHFFGLSLIDSTKAVFGISFVLSGLTMFLWARRLWGDIPGLAAAFLYAFAPYRFIDLYVRGAIGEHVAFIFPPLILYFLTRIAEKGNSRFSIIGGSLAVAGLMLSHNAISLMFYPLLILYILFLFRSKKLNKTYLYKTVIVFIFGMGLSAFFWMPAFLEGKYTLRDKVSAGEYAKRFVQVKDFLYGSWNYGGTGQFTVQVGIVQWLAVIGAFILTLKLNLKKNPYRIFMIVLLLIFLFSLFIMSNLSAPVWKIITTLQKFQFPWRFLSVTVFTTAVLGAVSLFLMPKRIQKYIFFLGLFFLLFLQKDYWHANNFLTLPDSFFQRTYYGTTDTGESAPIWSIRFMERPFKKEAEVVEGEGTITRTFRKSTQHIYSIDAKTTARIRENTLYFPGWNVFVDGEVLPIDAVNFQDERHRGLMTYYVSPGKHMVNVQFGETKLRRLADIVSILSVIGVLILLFLPKKLWLR